VLEAGSHELIRITEDGAAIETQTLDVIDRRWLLADRRARLPGRNGSWLQIADPALDGWWVAESGHAYALGQVEEAALVPGTKVTLSRSEHPVIASGELGPQRDDADGGVADEVGVAVDRRRVADGRTYLRLAGTRSAGAWIEVASRDAPPDAASLRVLESIARPHEATLALEPGERPAFLFDAAGRVVDRRTLAITPQSTFATLETRVVAGVRFLVIGRGELAGWAVAEGDGMRVIDSAVVPAARD
jgi:hypothetical protein